MQDWNDLRLVLSVARAGSLQGAARSLSIDHSTAYRRLQTLEAGLGLRLFERRGGTYRPTEAGERMAVAAERMEAETLALDRAITGHDASLSGSLRVTCSETLARRLLTDVVAGFRARHPGIRLALIIDNRQLDLSRREADVALRATIGWGSDRSIQCIHRVPTRFGRRAIATAPCRHTPVGAKRQTSGAVGGPTPLRKYAA